MVPGLLHPLTPTNHPIPSRCCKCSIGQLPQSSRIDSSVPHCSQSEHPASRGILTLGELFAWKHVCGITLFFLAWERSQNRMNKGINYHSEGLRSCRLEGSVKRSFGPSNQGVLLICREGVSFQTCLLTFWGQRSCVTKGAKAHKWGVLFKLFKLVGRPVLFRSFIVPGWCSANSFINFPALWRSA